MKTTHLILSLLVLGGAGIPVAAETTGGTVAPNPGSPEMTDDDASGTAPGSGLPSNGLTNQAPRAGSPAPPCDDRATNRALPSTPGVTEPGNSAGSSSGLNTPNPLPDDPFSADESRFGESSGNTPGGGPLDGGPPSGGTLGEPPRETFSDARSHETNRPTPDNGASISSSPAPPPGAGSAPRAGIPLDGQAVPCLPPTTR